MHRHPHFCLSVVICFTLFPFLWLTDLQGAPDLNGLQSAKGAAQDAEENHRPGPRSSQAAGDSSPPEEKSLQRHDAACQSLPRPPSPLTGDVFQLAPFKAPAKDGKAAPAVRKPADACDVFLHAPFGMKLENRNTVSCKARAFTRVAQQGAPFPGCRLLPAPSAPGVRAPYVHVETPVLQQPVAVHRVVSRIGQQAAVGSVAVGPLHAWTIGGRSLEDPFTAAPFQPRCSQGKP